MAFTPEGCGLLADRPLGAVGQAEAVALESGQLHRDLGADEQFVVGDLCATRQ